MYFGVIMMYRVLDTDYDTNIPRMILCVRIIETESRSKFHGDWQGDWQRDVYV